MQISVSTSLKVTCQCKRCAFFSAIYLDIDRTRVEKEKEMVLKYFIRTVNPLINTLCRVAQSFADLTFRIFSFKRLICVNVPHPRAGRLGSSLNSSTIPSRSRKARLISAPVDDASRFERARRLRAERKERWDAVKQAKTHTMKRGCPDQTSY